MAQTKTEFKYFTIFQYKAEQEYLREMHLKGWSLVKITFPGFYHFEACGPEDVVYQLDYNQNGTAHKREYVQLFADCGWEYLFDFVGYSYFRKPVSRMEGMEEPEEIFCDDESRLEMMKRVFRGRVAPLLCIFFCSVLPQFFLQTSQFGRSVFSRGFAITYLILLVVYLAIFILFGIQFFMYEKKVREPDKKTRIKYGGLMLAALIVCALVVFNIVSFWKPMDSEYSLYEAPDEYNIGAAYLDETIRHGMELEAGDGLEVTLQILEGDIYLCIYLDEEAPIYEGTFSRSTHLSLTLPIHEDGIYTILTTGKQAEGSFCFQRK